MTQTIQQIAREAFGSTVPGTEANQLPLTGHDRCDTRECGAQAYVRVEFKSGSLLFCGHHYATAPHSLQTQSISIHDERAKIGAERLDVSA